MRPPLSPEKEVSSERLQPDFMRAATACMGEGLYAVDAEGLVVFINPTAEKMFGYEPGELLGKRMHEHTHHSYPDGSVFPIEACAGFQVKTTGCTITDYEDTFIRKDGRFFPVRYTAAPLIWQEEISGVVVAFQDISKTKHTEEALIESQKRYKEVLENTYDGIWTWDIKTNDIFWNDRLYEMHGLSPKSFQPTLEAFTELVHPDDRAMVMAALQAHLTDGTQYELEIRQKHSSGDYRYFFARGTAIRDEHGIPLRMVGATNDITGKKQAELALMASEKRFRVMADTTPIMVWIGDTQGGQTYGNKRWLDFTGLSAEQSAGFGWTQKIHPDDQESAYQGYLKALTQQQNYSAEWRLLRASDETYRWVWSTGVPQYAPTGDFLGYIGTVIDITERKQAEDALRENDARLRAIDKAMAYGIWMCNPAGEATYASESFLQLIGQTWEECRQFGWTDKLPPADVEPMLAEWAHCLKTGDTFNYEHQFLGTDGKRHPILARGIAIHDQEGNITSWIGINLDISQLKQAEDALKESEERFRTMADAAPVMIWTSDADGNDSYFNRIWLDFTGRSLEAELAGGWRTGIHPDDVAHVTEVCRNAKRGYEAFTLEFRFKRHDGEYRWILDTATPRFSPEGLFSGYIGSCIDITDIKLAAENFRLAKEAAEEASQRKSQFLANMSHELRTPLNAIIGYSEMMLQGMDLTPEKKEKYAQNIATSGHHLLTLINEILDISKIEAGKMTLALKYIDLNAFAQSLAEVVQELAAIKKVHLTFDFQADLEGIKADPVKLKQIFFNLISNAIKFNRENGQVLVLFHQMKGGDAFIGQIQDTGIGIPHDKLGHLFTEFYQVDDSMARRHEGTGLGLALTKKLVELHGGSISVESEEGIGTSFTFILPNSATPIS